MKKTLLLALCIFSILIVNTQVHSQEDNEKKFAKLSNKLISDLQNNDFKSASELFHYPATLKPEEKIKEKEKVAWKLKTVNDAFGGLARFRSGKVSQASIGVGVSGAEITYWKESKKKFRKTIFPVDFKKEGPGFLIIGFCDINNNIQIQGVEFALPPSKKARERISEINKKIGQKGKEGN